MEKPLYYDIIIIGSGISGLFSAYKINASKNKLSFLILEKYKKEWLGGRTSNENFYDVEVVTGAGIGRKDKNPLLINLLNKLNISYKSFISKISYSHTFTPVNIMKIINYLKKEYHNHSSLHSLTFKQYFIKILGSKLYKSFLISAGFTDYEYSDVKETLYNYGMDDNMDGWSGLHIPWKKLVDKLYNIIGPKHFEFSTPVTNIKKIQDKPCLFEIKSEKNKIFYCNKVIIATTIESIIQLVPGAKEKNSIYQRIHGQPFLRLYAKFDDSSTKIMSEYVPNYTIVPGPLQKILPVDKNKGVYMISYSDNKNALFLKPYLQNTKQNREMLCYLIEKSLGIPLHTLKIIGIKDFYWPIGTHYYDPLKNFKSRDDFVKKAQNPEKGMLVVGEVVSRYQGWVEGALESVEKVVTNKWIENNC